MSLRDTVLVALGALSLVWYYICLVALGKKPLPSGQPSTAFRQFQSLSLTTLSVSLATFLGMLLGLRQVGENFEAASSPTIALPEFSAVHPAERREIAILAKSFNAFQTFQLDTVSVDSIQWAAAALYVVSLFLALYFWYRQGDSTDPAVINLGKSLLGLMGGALSIVLSLPS